MKKVLVLCEDYPSDSHPYKMAWAHTRNVAYSKAGFDVTVCSFSARGGYSFQGVKIITEEALTMMQIDSYDIFVSHSPNIRNHLRLLAKVRAKPIVLFCHGTESLYVNHDYCEPYPFMKEAFSKRLIRSIYDFLKMHLLRYFVTANRSRVHVVFVSDWMRKKFFKNVGDLDVIGVRYSIVNNPLWDDFYHRNYIEEVSGAYSADFITLRRLDFSKYAIDQVVSFAEANPQYKFHIVGEGEYFENYKKPDNVTVFNRHVAQTDLANFLLNYRCALMPTRVDAQGVMVCEMAVFGMPVITSDIAVCHEMLDGFSNVAFLNSHEFQSSFTEDRLPVGSSSKYNKARFSYSSTVAKEVELLHNMIETIHA